MKEVGKMNENCKGCHSRPNCIHTALNKYGMCPCSNCLVKVTCTHGCDEYQEYFNDNEIPCCAKFTR